MSTWRPSKCCDCGTPADAGVKISRQGFCPDCGLARTLAAARSMITREGEHYERFQAARAAGRVGRPRKGVVGTGPALDDDPKNAAGTKREPRRHDPR